MVNLILDNIKLLFSLFLLLIITQWFIYFFYKKIKSRWKYSKIRKSPPIKRTQKALSIVFYIVSLALFITIQEEYNIIQLDDKETYFNLVIGVLTLYGILYAFIQFTISYAVQNKNDKYWGKSLTRSLLTKQLEFDIFNSTIFKFLLVYASVFPMLNINMILKNPFINIYNYYFALSFWKVSIFSIYILYIFLFIKSLFIMNLFFNIQENRNRWLKYMIEEEIAEEYVLSFNYSIEIKSNYFLDKLFEELKLLAKNEQKDMLMHILNNTFFEYVYQINKYNKFNKLFKKKLRESNNRTLYLYRMFQMLFKELEYSQIKLDFQDLLSIYHWQDEIIYKHLYISNLGQYEQIIEEIALIYTDKNPTWAFEKSCKYFKVPELIWNSIGSYEELEELHKNIMNRRGFKIVLKANNLTNSEKVILDSYKSYLYDFLNKYKDFFNSLKKHSSYSYFFGSLNSYNKRVNIDDRVKNIIYSYIINTEYNSLNKDYVIFLTDRLDYKYKVAIIFYHMLYTGSDSKWQYDIFFLRSIIENYWENETITNEHVVEFICNKIEKSNIGHRIGRDLIKWIINHLKITTLNEEIVNKCINDRYISYATLLKFIYLFSESRYSYLGFYDFDFNKVEQPTGRDWIIEFLHEMLQTPVMFKEEFFTQHLFSLFRKITDPFTNDHFLLENDFRLFFINPFFEFSEEKFNNTKDQGYFGKGIIEFLVLQLGEERYNYLISSESSSKYFSSHVKKIINNKNMLIENYVSNLVGRANECNITPVSIIRENEIIAKLKNLLN